MALKCPESGAFRVVRVLNDFCLLPRKEQSAVQWLTDNVSDILKLEFR